MLRPPRAGPFHGLAPYTEDDRLVLFGRAAEGAALLALARDPAAQVILVTGEVASGKTSLLRAGLVAAGPPTVLPVYLELGPGWQYQLREALSRAIERPISADDDPARLLAEASRQRRARPLLIVDPVEMLLWMEDPEVEAVRKVLAGLAAVPGLGVVLAVDRGNHHAISRLGIGAAGISAERTVTLGRFTREQAAEVMEQTILGCGGYMESGLPQQMAHDLAGNGPVLPAALQVLGHAATIRQVTSHRAYARAGGAMTLTAFYVDMLAARAGAWRAKKVLAVLSEQASPRVPVELETVARGAGLEPHEAERVLAALEEEGLVRSYSLPPVLSAQPHPGAATPLASGHTVLHPFLRQPLRDLVAPISRGRAAARLALQRRMHQEQVLRPIESIAVHRYLGSALEPRERLHLDRSLRTWYGVAALCLALPVLVIGALYWTMASSAHLAVARTAGGAHTVVLASGTPALDTLAPLIPGRFDQVEVDTALAPRSLPPRLREALARRELRGRIRQPAGRPPWAAQLFAALPPVRRAAMLILAGEREEGSRLLVEAAAQPASRRRAIIWATLLLDKTEEIRRVLVAGAGDPRPEIRLLALERSRRLGVEALPLFRQALGDRDAQVRGRALAALAARSDLSPTESVPILGPLLDDPDPRVQQAARARLDALSHRHPLQVLDELLVLGDERGHPRAELDRAIERLLASDRKTLAAHLCALLARRQSSDRRALLLHWLGSLADEIPAGKLPLAQLVKDPDLAVRAAAMSLQARFTAPDEATRTLGELARAAGNRPAAVAQRRAAATGLGLIPGQADRDRLGLLKGLVRDREAPVRAAAVRSLLRVGTLGLLELARVMKSGSADVPEAALQVICEGHTSNRISTTILGVAWKLKRENLRQRALRCAESLPAASLRLRVWLADEAIKDKDPKVRRAGAAAAAMALREGGTQFLRMGRLYLKDPDPELRRALLDAIAERPPASGGFLSELVERGSRDPEPIVRAAAARLVRLGARTPAAALVGLRKLLEDGDGRVRRAALLTAGELKGGPDRSLLEGPFGNLLGGGSVEDALEAVPIAGRLRLQQALHRGTAHSDARVRAASLGALLPNLAGSTALVLLEAALRDPQPTVGEVALRAAGGLDPSLGAALGKLLDRASISSLPSTRAEAFRALGRVNGDAAAAAFEVLQRAAHDPSEERRRLAMAALGELAARDHHAAWLLAEGVEDPAVDVRRQAREALAAYLGASAASLPELWSLLIESEARGAVRQVAIAALAHLGRKHGARRLGELVAALPADTPVATRIAANLALALASTGDPPEPAIGWLYGW